MDKETITIDEKLDEILKYQKSAARWQMVRTIFGLILFIIFFVLPIIWTIYLIQNFDFSPINQIAEEVKNGSGDLMQIKNKLEMFR